MQHKRILVLGCCGSGKSTFARRLGALTGLPVVHLDSLFWKPGWVQSTREEFYPLVQDALAMDEWIMDGNYTTTLPWRLERCDLVFWFELPRIVCLWGIVSRVFKYRHKDRPDIAEHCPEKIDWEFVKYTWDFNKTHGPKSRELIHLSGKPVITFRSRREARHYLEGIKHDDAADRENEAPSPDDR